MKGLSGEPISLPPYGYIKDPDNLKKWIVEEEAAAIVRRIYNMTLVGFGIEQIAVILDKDEILTPINYWKERGVNHRGIKKLSDQQSGVNRVL